LVQGITPPYPWVAGLQIALHAFQEHLPIQTTMREIGPVRVAVRTADAREPGSVRAIHRARVSRRYPFTIAFWDNPIDLDDFLELDPVLHPTQSNPAVERRRRQLGDGFAMAGNDHSSRPLLPG
jgi:hypothetical protein